MNYWKESVSVAMTFAIVCGGMTVDVVRADDAKNAKVEATSGSAPPSDELTPEAQRMAEVLRARLPEDSEAREMLEHILKGSRLGPGEGWFRLAVAQNRLGWQYVESTFDTNGNGSIRPDEFPGSHSDFARLDRDGNHLLDHSDFDWSESSTTRTPGYLMFFQADRDANGKVTQEEMIALFKSLDSDNQDYLSLDDVRDQFIPPTERQVTTRRDGPTRSTLVLGLERQEIGSLQPGPQLNDKAPDFTLKSLSGESVTLSEEIGEQPVVLIFGNFTCGPFRSQSGNVEKLYERYEDRAKFFLVYVREAHPTDGWSMTSNHRAGIEISQPQSNKERFEVAQMCQSHLDFQIPFLVDSVDDKVGAMYSGMPNRLYLIDSAGRIAFKNGRGPFGFHPRELEQSLILLLNESGTASQPR